MSATELLAPAGTLNNLRYAIAYGADAVYAGMPRYSLRVRNNDFLEDNLRVGIDEAQWQVLPPASERRTCRVLFWGTFIPLHGVEYIVEMAALLEQRDDRLTARNRVFVFLRLACGERISPGFFRFRH